MLVDGQKLDTKSGFGCPHPDALDEPCGQLERGGSERGLWARATARAGGSTASVNLEVLAARAVGSFAPLSDG